MYWTTELYENAKYVIFSKFYECAIIGVIPLLLLCFLNYKIYYSIHQSTIRYETRVKVEKSSGWAPGLAPWIGPPMLILPWATLNPNCPFPGLCP